MYGIKELIEKRDCRLCFHYRGGIDVSQSVALLYSQCTRDYFNFEANRAMKPEERPAFQCNGKDYSFDPLGEFVPKEIRAKFV